MQTSSVTTTSTSSTPQPIFLGLEKPPLLSAVDWFFEQFWDRNRSSATWNLAQVIVALPTSRSQQRLTQLLRHHANQQGLELLPPTILTIGELPEFLYAANKPLASNLVQNLAWAKGLAEMEPEDFRMLTGRDPSERPDDWEPLATLIAALHARLSNDIWSFRSVARNLAQETGFLKGELLRWEVLERLQKRYYQILTELGLWDRQAARNYAAAGLLKAHELRCQTDKTIVMVAVADLSRSIAEMLRQIYLQNPDQVKILIADSSQHADRFDPYGSLITEQWLGQTIPLRNDQIRIADRPSDQAHLAMQYLRGLSGFVTDQITVGVPDENVVPELERQLQQLELPFRTLPGRPLAETAPIRLLKFCSLYLKSFSFDAFSSLVRHPDLFRWLSQQVDSSDWLQHLTIFQNQTLPDRIAIDPDLTFGDPHLISQQFEPDDPGSKKRADARSAMANLLNHVLASLRGLLVEFCAPEQSLSVWGERWKNLLLTIYGDRQINRQISEQRELLAAIQFLFRAFEHQSSVPPQLQSPTLATRSLELALKEICEHRLPPAELPAAIELAGWLDLALDDAPVLVITGMNDGSVPTAERGHPFLPNELCKKLQILDNDRRYARDCQALTVIGAIRENLLLIAGRRDSQGEPLKPSRLLFADTPTNAALRAKGFFEFLGSVRPVDSLSDPCTAPTAQQLKLPQPVGFQPLSQITVTRFRDYIKCPYRFYLKHVMRLESVNDDARELDAGLFGDLVHNCLEAFGKDAVADSRDEKKINRFLNDRLKHFVNLYYGGNSLPAVEIQIAQVRQRFEVFAKLQAARRESGWRIVSTEEMLEHDFMVDGEPFKIRGKIDRIDQHEISGQVAIWDYKTSDKGAAPGAVHYAPNLKKWHDLQLPLYRHLVKEVSAVAGCHLKNLTLGYVILPKRLEEIRFEFADWSEELLDSADELAREIIRQIRRSVFWPPAPQPPLYSEEFAAICQDNVFDRWRIPELVQ